MVKHTKITAASLAAVLSPLAGLAALTAALPARGVDRHFAERVISTTASGAGSVFATDVDGDGDIAVLSASSFDNKIACYENTTCGGGTIEPDEQCDDAGESATFDTDCTFAMFGNATLNVTAGEECDGGLHCTACLCDPDFGPTDPPSLDCELICGNGRLDPGEECDGGFACTDCLCDADFESTAPVSLSCQRICGNGFLDPGEECDGGLGCTDCVCDGGVDTAPPFLYCLISRVISTNANGATSVFATDVDGDGDTDVLSASIFDDKIAWYESDGGSPPSFTERVISTTAVNARSVFATDMDGDGDTDVLSASSGDNKIAWYESDGGSPPSFTERVISTTADTAWSVFATDLDGDGDTDVLSAAIFDDKIAWYENDGGSPPTFTERVISTTAVGHVSVFATDLDGDGDIDVLSAAFGDAKIVWYENDGGSPPAFSERVISTTAEGAISVFATDLDGDGDTDVLSAAFLDNKIAWYENDGGSPPTFTSRVISAFVSGADSVFATDLDGDGDIDVLSTSASTDRIEWYENDGGSPPAFSQRFVSNAANGPISVFATDVDGDGDTDVLSASATDGKIAWHENRTPLCGNGTVNPGEECDDGNTESGDGCGETCRIEFGACCVATTCSVTSEADCSVSSGTFYGFLSTCDLPDADGDGLRNECDGCPDDGNKIVPGICGCGVDDNADSDGDGVPDCDDQCPGVDDAVFAPECDGAIPTTSLWGLIVLTLLLLVGIKMICFGRRV